MWFVPDLTELLTAAVRIATGLDDADPRPGQLDLALDIEQAMEFKGQVVGEAPTGTGKSFAHLCAAAHAWVNRGERTLVSTESLALQGQFVEKDLPVVSQALERVGAQPLDFALLKGVSNYVDPLQLQATIDELEPARHHSPLQAADRLDDGTIHPPDGIPANALANLLRWADEACRNAEVSGDRADYPYYLNSRMWQMVSSDQTTATDYPELPPAERAREAASQAAVIVTNHALLGIQAAKAVPVVIGSTKIGEIHNIVIDEGHALPASVRNQGAEVFSGTQLRLLASAVEKAAEVNSLSGPVIGLSEGLNRAISNFLMGKPERSVTELDDPIPPTLAADIRAWLGSAKRVISKADPSTPNGMLSKARAVSRVERMQGALASVLSYRVDQAAWAERDDRGVSLRVSPVHVGGAIKANLLHHNDEPLGAAIVSATLPHGFGYQVGSSEPTTQYESPFDHAYAQSCAFVPKVTDLAEAGLTSSRYGKPKFDTELHAEWCMPIMADLIRANSGSALVLSATRRAGEQYAASLAQEFPELHVISQWQAGSTQQAVAEWKSNTTSVLVGTRGLMTGVDAPGETNTLVIIDRVPRAAKNPIDDARVEMLKERGIAHWEADSRVYAADAGLLLEQAMGRLIRSTSDTGAAAVLDPRVNPASEGSYKGTSRRIYAEPFLRFGARFGDIDDAVVWLKDRKLAPEAAADIQG